MILLPMLLPTLLMAAAGQRADRSTDRLPPANALSPGEDAPAAVLAPVEAVLRARTALEVLSNVTGIGGVIVVEEDGPAAGLRTQDWYKFAEAAAATVSDDRLTDPAVEADGRLATVWSPYVSYRGTKVDHCGVDQVSLLLTPGTGWKVMNLVRSVRRTGCPVPERP